MRKAIGDGCLGVFSAFLPVFWLKQEIAKRKRLKLPRVDPRLREHEL
jgi:hypothetical protein